MQLQDKNFDLETIESEMSTKLYKPNKSIRLLHVFQMSKHLGPKLIMIRKMTADILYLMAVLSVFMLWYGVVRIDSRSGNLLEPKIVSCKNLNDIICM